MGNVYWHVFQRTPWFWQRPCSAGVSSNNTRPNPSSLFIGGPVVFLRWF